MSVYKLPNGSSYKLPSTYTSTGVYNKPSTYKTASTYKPSYTYTDPATTIAMRAEKARLQQQQAQKDEKNWLEQVGTGITDYNDPYALNSLNDAIFNKDAKAQRLGDWTKTWWGYLPGVITAAGVNVWDNNIAPIINTTAQNIKNTNGNKVGAFFEGASAGISASVLNGLVNLGETMDIVANPIKGAILDGSDGFLKATGFKEGEGRTNYDFNFKPTNNKFINGAANFGLELVVDPLNYISFGGKGAITAGAKAANKITKEAVPELTEAIAKKASKSVLSSVRNAISGDAVDRAIVKFALGDATRDEAVAQTSRVIAKELGHNTERKTYKAALRKASKKANSELSKKVIKESLKAFDKEAYEATQKYAANIVDNVVRSNLPNSAAAKLYRASEGFQKGILKATMIPTPVGTGIMSYKLGKNLLQTKLRNSLEAINKNDYFDADLIDKHIRKDTIGMPPPVVRYYQAELDKKAKDVVKASNTSLVDHINAIYSKLKPSLDETGMLDNANKDDIINYLDEFLNNDTFKLSYGHNVHDAASFVKQMEGTTDPQIAKLRDATADLLNIRKYYDDIEAYKIKYAPGLALKENVDIIRGIKSGSFDDTPTTFRQKYNASIRSLEKELEAMHPGKYAGLFIELDIAVYSTLASKLAQTPSLKHLKIPGPTVYKGVYDSLNVTDQKMLDTLFKVSVRSESQKLNPILAIADSLYPVGVEPVMPALKNRLRTIKDVLADDVATISKLRAKKAAWLQAADESPTQRSHKRYKRQSVPNIDVMRINDVIDMLQDLKVFISSVDLDKLKFTTPTVDSAFQDAISDFKIRADAILNTDIYNIKSAEARSLYREYYEAYDRIQYMIEQSVKHKSITNPDASLANELARQNAISLKEKCADIVTVLDKEVNSTTAGNVLNKIRTFLKSANNPHIEDSNVKLVFLKDYFKKNNDIRIKNIDELYAIINSVPTAQSKAVFDFNVTRMYNAVMEECVEQAHSFVRAVKTEQAKHIPRVERYIPAGLSLDDAITSKEAVLYPFDKDVHKAFINYITSKKMTFPDYYKDLNELVKDGLGIDKQYYDAFMTVHNGGRLYADLGKTSSDIVSNGDSNVADFADLLSEQIFRDIAPDPTASTKTFSQAAVKHGKNTIDLDKDSAYIAYHQRLANAYVTQRLASIPEVSDLIVLINDPKSDLNKVITLLAKDDPGYANKLRQDLNAFTTYNSFVTSLLQISPDDVPQNILFSFLDALNSEGMTNPQTVADNLEWMWDGIMRRTVSNNKNRAEILESSALENLPSQQPWIKLDKDGLIKEVLDKVKGHQHTAHYDVAANKYVISDKRSIYYDAFQDAVKSIVGSKGEAGLIWYDIETTGLHGSTANILQLALDYDEASGASKQVYNKFISDQTPLKSVMKKLGHNTETEFLTEYSAKTGALEEIKAYDMLLSAMTDVIKQGKQPILVGHNIDAFDTRFLIDRARQLKFHNDLLEDTNARESLIRALKNIDSIDTLDVVHKVKGVETVSETAQNILKKETYKYVNDLVAHHNESFMKPVASGLTDKLKELEDFLKGEISGAKKTQIDDITNKPVTLKGSRKGKSTGLYEHTKEIIGNVRTAITDSFKELGDMKRALATEVIVKSDLEDINENITHLMNKGVKGMQMYSSIKAVDTTLFDDIYKLPNRKLYNDAPTYHRNPTGIGVTPDASNITNPEVLTTLAKRVDNKASYIRNSVVLKENIDDIIKLGTFMRDYYARDIQPTLNGHALYSSLHPHSLVYFNYNKKLPTYAQAMLEVTMSTFNRDRALYERFLNELSTKDKDLYEFCLKYTKGLNDAKSIRKQLTMAPYRFNADDPVNLASFNRMPDSLADYKSQMRLFQSCVTNAMEDTGTQLGMAFENTGLTTTAALRYNTRKEYLVGMFDRVTDYIARLKDAEYATLKRNAILQADHMNIHQMEHFKKLTGDELMEYMYNSAGRVIFIPNKELKMTGDIIDSYAKQGIIVYQDTTQAQPMYFFALTKDKYAYCKAKFGAVVKGTNTVAEHSTYNPNLYIPKYEFGFDNEDYFEVVGREFREEVNKVMPGIGSTNGALLHADTIDTIDKLLPAHILESMVSKQQLYDDGFFNTLRYDTTLLGLTEGKRLINQYTAVNPLKPLIETYLQSQQRLSTKAQYASVFFNKTISLNNSELFSKLDDKTLLRMFKEHNEYAAVALVKDKHLADGMKVTQLPTRNAKDLAVARKLDAIIVPINTYYDLCKVLNDYSSMPGFLKFINGHITATYKAFMLATPGFIVRNLCDGLGKNGADGYTAMSLPRAVTHWFDTVKLYKKYLDTEEAFVTYLTDNNLKISNNAIYDFFEQAGKLDIDQDTFEICYNFFKEGFGSLSDTLQAFVKPIDKNVAEATGLADHINNYNRGLYGLPFIKHLGNLNSHVEQTLRLSCFLTALENGATTPQAMKAVLKNHFDYANKPYIQRVVETFFPFIGFSIKNFEYYMDIYANKGWLANVTTDVMKPLMHFNSTHDEHINYEAVPRRTVWEDPLGRSLMTKYIPASELYHILAGNIQLDLGVTNKANETQELMQVLKISPSIMDAVNLSSNPLDSMYSRLLPILRYAVEYKNMNTYAKDKDEQFFDALPAVGTLKLRYDSAKTAFERSGNPLQALGTLAGLTGVSTKYKQFDGSEEALEGASKKQKNIWYAQAKAGWKDDKYNPYYQPPKEGYDMFKGFLAKEYAKYKEYNLPPEENPYVKYAHLVPPEKRATQAVYEAFNPSKSSRNASEAQVRAWYSYYKEHNLPLKQNPYRYYPKYNKWAKKGVTRTINNSAVFKSYKNYYSTAKGAYTPKTYSYSYQANPMYSFGQVAKMVNNWKVRQIMNGFIYAGKPKYSNYKTLRAMALKNMDRTAYRLIYSSR